MSDNSQEYAAEIAQWRVKSGFWTLADLINNTAEVLEHDEGTTPREATRMARQIVIPLWNEQLALQQSWPQEEKTIEEKLAVAFDSLDKNHKIPALMNFTCCRTCGVSEIGGDWTGDDPVGYAFFHEQTTEGFVKFPGSTIMIYYGTFQGSPMKCLDVGNTVVRVLRRAGLSVEWDGDTKRGIEVVCEEWKKRLIVKEGDFDEADSDYYSDDDKEGEEEEEIETEDSEMDDLSEGELSGLLQDASEPI
ncbi:hypothetical protein GX50_05295 [[Emmonsia] crescens]|uniref:DUF6891 domain-containing protein n=1 Tax=[Emmonsia] crescens TaxID=73230 RepID=A0A2B7ZFW9_9EURO|nr:hypothetical protein GX50_05295 [Emmonsia crescens]